MQTKKAKYHLKRIETILDLHEDSLSSLDRDILLEDIRHLYDLVLHAETGHPVQDAIAARDHSIARPEPAPVRPVEAKPQPEPESNSISAENNATPSNDQNNLKPQQHETPAPAPVESVLPESTREEIPPARDHVHTPATVTFEESTRDTQDSHHDRPSDRPASQEQLNGRTESAPSQLAVEESYVETLTEEDQTYPDLFDFTMSSDLSDRLGNSKIEHLNRILTINDKILFINHLYGGEAIPFQESLKKFEGFYTYEEAKQYASRDLVSQYNWTDADKYDTVRQFMRQVKRLYS